MNICWKTFGYRTTLETLYFSGAHRVLAPLTRGIGMVYMLHRVVPARRDAFQPNGFLEIEPDFLEQVILDTRADGIDFVSLDDAHQRLVDGAFDRRFAVVTLDDGYRDNAVHALPLFRKHDVPFTIFASSGIVDATCELWWIALEKIIAGSDELRVDTQGLSQSFSLITPREKAEAFNRLGTWLGRELDEHAQRRAIRDMAQRAGLDLSAMCRSLAMDWDELRAIAAQPLATIGAHTLGHHAVARLSEAEARHQISSDMARLEAELGCRPRHFAYPYGSREAAGPRDFDIAAELGFKTAVTTRPGQIFTAHRDHLMALPRVSLNGLYQKKRYAGMLRAGVPFALYNRFRHLNVA